MAKPKIEQAIAEKEAELEALLDGFAGLSAKLKERANKRGDALQKEIDALQRDLADLRIPWENLRADLAVRQEALERATTTLNQEGQFRQKAEALKTVVGRIVCHFSPKGRRCPLKSIDIYAPEDAAVRPLTFPVESPHWNSCQDATVFFQMDLAETVRKLPVSQQKIQPPMPVDPWPSLPKWPNVFRAWLLFTGVVLPCICFLITYPEGPRWQSAAASAYAQILLSRTPTLPLYPFLLYNMTCMVLLVVRPDRWWGNSLVRFGIHTGVPVAAEYWIVFQVATNRQATPSLTSAVLPVAVSVTAAVIPVALGRLMLAYPWVRYLFLTVAAILLPVASPLGIVVCLFCATPWALAAYATVSFELIRRGGPNRFRYSLAQLLAAFTWFAASTNRCGS